MLPLPTTPMTSKINRSLCARTLNIKHYYQHEICVTAVYSNFKKNMQKYFSKICFDET